MTKDFNRDGGESCVNSVKKSWNIVKTYGKTGDVNEEIFVSLLGRIKFLPPLKPVRPLYQNMKE